MASLRKRNLTAKRRKYLRRHSTTNVEIKTKRIVGMTAFIFLTILFLWHVYYEYWRIAGFRETGLRNDSLAWAYISSLYGDNYYRNDSVTHWWLATHLLPIPVAWVTRDLLGKCVHGVILASHKIYGWV
jgi:hypothetical protein